MWELVPQTGGSECHPPSTGCRVCEHGLKTGWGAGGTVMVLRPKPGTPEHERVAERTEDAPLRYSTTSSWDIDVGSLWVNPVYVASWTQGRASPHYHAGRALVLTAPTFL